VSGSLQTLLQGLIHVFGCDLQLGGAASRLTGRLLDGSSLDVAVSGNIIPHSDNNPPTLSCPANLTATATQAGGAVVSYPAPTVSDDRPGWTLACSPPSGSLFPVGPTPVNCTATDACGHRSTCQFTVTVLPIADLTVSMTATDSHVRGDRLLTYTLPVRNNGPHTAQGVVVTDPVPAGTVFVSATPSPNSAPGVGAGGTVSWTVGSLAPNQTVSLQVTVKVTDKSKSSISNTATVSSDAALSPDPNPGNNSATLLTR
jgi:uncharacterized repeat protein (TIGR01451 family)